MGIDPGFVARMMGQSPEAWEYIETDEYVEITPDAIRLRKILLTENERKRESRKPKAEA